MASGEKHSAQQPLPPKQKDCHDYGGFQQSSWYRAAPRHPPRLWGGPPPFMIFMPSSGRPPYVASHFLHPSREKQHAAEEFWSRAHAATAAAEIPGLSCGSDFSTCDVAAAADADAAAFEASSSRCDRGGRHRGRSSRHSEARSYSAHQQPPQHSRQLYEQPPYRLFEQQGGPPAFPVAPFPQQSHQQHHATTLKQPHGRGYADVSTKFRGEPRQGPRFRGGRVAEKLQSGGGLQSHLQGGYSGDFSLGPRAASECGDASLQCIPPYSTGPQRPYGGGVFSKGSATSAPPPEGSWVAADYGRRTQGCLYVQPKYRQQQKAHAHLQPFYPQQEGLQQQQQQEQQQEQEQEQEQQRQQRQEQAQLQHAAQDPASKERSSSMGSQAASGASGDCCRSPLSTSSLQSEPSFSKGASDNDSQLSDRLPSRELPPSASQSALALGRAKKASEAASSLSLAAGEGRGCKGDVPLEQRSRQGECLDAQAAAAGIETTDLHPASRGAAVSAAAAAPADSNNSAALLAESSSFADRGDEDAVRHSAQVQRCRGSRNRAGAADEAPSAAAAATGGGSPPVAPLAARGLSASGVQAEFAANAASCSVGSGCPVQSPTSEGEGGAEPFFSDIGKAQEEGLSRGLFNLTSFLIATTPAVRVSRRFRRSKPSSTPAREASGAAAADARTTAHAVQLHDGGAAAPVRSSACTPVLSNPGEQEHGRGGGEGAASSSACTLLNARADCPPAEEAGVGAEGSKVEEEEGLPSFPLSELWRSFDDASTFGLEVPLLDEEQRIAYVIYVPYLSALHLFPRKRQQVQPEQQPEPKEGDFSSSSGSGTTEDTSTTRPGCGGCFRYMEVRLPYQRRPLSQQVTQLLQGAEVTQSQQLKLLCSSSEELSDESWCIDICTSLHVSVCFYRALSAAAIQREFCKVPAPSFLVYYRLRLTASPQAPFCAPDAIASDDATASPRSAAAESSPKRQGQRSAGCCAEHGAEDAKKEACKGQQQHRSAEGPLPTGGTVGELQSGEKGKDRFIALARFAVIASKGQQEWLSSAQHFLRLSRLLRGNRGACYLCSGASSGNDDRSQFFKAEMMRLEEWLKKSHVNHPDFNSFRTGTVKR
ncbi:hypothetical protein cyc_00379 [Cyclospora cayetanensis]|uniref:Uncharacterized protein n=1 Tax=Cyclospora cayetanensis TaxID=88456 RepID=A0A1D3CZ61_9EIME|nr:hypothetical protein cyc_00379 [Cyclospora cayetanensis]